MGSFMALPVIRAGKFFSTDGTAIGVTNFTMGIFMFGQIALQ